MRSRAGFSLVEMVIVLVLAGLVSVAAISMFSTQNRLNAAMTALGESQENARSAVQVIATELRALSGGSVVAAESDRLVVRIPVTIGVVCAATESSSTVYLPLEGQELDLADLDGYATRDTTGEWTYRTVDVGRVLDFRGNPRQDCIDAGNGGAGENGDYATLTTFGGGWRGRGGGRGRGGSGSGEPLGTSVLVFREYEYSFGPSALDPEKRAFYRGRPDGTLVELAQGFAESARLEYRMGLADDFWFPMVWNWFTEDIVAIRLIADVQGDGSSGNARGTASFSLTREVPLRNTR